jgi:HD-like signal output (HDOD) protein
MDIISSGEAHYYLLKPFRQEDVAALARHITAQQSELRNQKLAMTLSTFTGLPVPQRFQNRLTYLLSKPNVPLHEIIGEIEKNPGLLAKILRIANSMHYWTRSPIVSLREAIIFIGIEYLETLVMASDVFENIMKSARRDVRNMYETLWNSSLRRAVIAKRIAEKSGMRKETSTIHVAALLQDIGLLARLCLEPDAYMKMGLFAEEQHVSLYAAEMRIFTTTHDELGGGLLKRWNFPHEVVFAITNHHCEIFGDKITEIVQLSDALDVSGRAEPHDEGILPHINIWKEEFEGMFVEDQTQSH